MSLPSLPIPALLGVTTTPIINQDGRIHAAQGYDLESRLYYYPPAGTVIPPIPEAPSDDDVRRAAEIIREPFHDFPFVDDTSRTHCMASLLTAVLRPMIDGSVPMALIDKPVPGTGASLIGELIGIITSGTAAAVTPCPKSDEEWGKQITTTLMGGSTLMIVDNVEQKLYSSSLAIVLTASYWRQRALKTNEEVEIPIRLAVIANGNNISLGGDLPRRVFWCRMDPNCARPWQREIEYRHPDIRAWTLENRGEILWGILTLTRGWIIAGRPGPSKETPKLGGYESWRRVIGGVLAHGGFGGFLGNLEELYESMDVDGTQWDAFISCWFAKWGDRPILVSDLIETITAERISTDNRYADPAPISAVLPDDISDSFTRGKSPSRGFGRALGKRKDRFFSGGLKLVAGPKIHSAVSWRVKLVVKKTKAPNDNSTNDAIGIGGVGELGELGELRSLCTHGTDFGNICTQKDLSRGEAKTNSPNSPNSPEQDRESSENIPTPTKDEMHPTSGAPAPRIDDAPGEVTASLRKCCTARSIPSAKDFKKLETTEQSQCLVCGKPSHIRCNTPTRDRRQNMVHKMVHAHALFKAGYGGPLCEQCLEKLKWEQLKTRSTGSTPAPTGEVAA